MTIRIEVQGSHAAAAAAIVRGAASLGIPALRACLIRRVYFLEADPGDAAIDRLCTLLLVDPVTESASWGLAEVGAGAPQGEMLHGFIAQKLARHHVQLRGAEVAFEEITRRSGNLTRRQSDFRHAARRW